MQTNVEKFFEDKANSNLWDLATSIKRNNPLPLDNDSIFNSYEDLSEYVSSSAIAYPGQIVAVVTINETKIYYLNQNLEIVPIEGGINIESLPHDIKINSNNGKISLVDSNGNFLGGGVDLPKDISGLDSEVSESEENGKQVTLWLLDSNGDRIEDSKTSFAGGGGGGMDSSYIVNIERITNTPLVITPTDEALIKFNFELKDATGVTSDGYFTWKLGSRILTSGVLNQGYNEFNVVEYLTTGTTTKFDLLIYSDDARTNVIRRISWNVQVVDVRIESSFNDKRTYTAEKEIPFNYIVYGAVNKKVHFKLNGEEIGTFDTSNSGGTQTFIVPGKPHGAYLLEVYATATIGTSDIETSHIYKDIIFYDSDNSTPIIGCPYRKDYHGALNVTQYNSVEIPFYIVDPSTNNPTLIKDTTIQIKDKDGNNLRLETLPSSEETLNGNVFNWVIKPSEIGTYDLKISCGDTSVEVALESKYIGFDVIPVGGYAFDFNPSGRSNSNQLDREWTESSNSDIKMTVSDNFDWQNGGYKIDSDGNSCFCIKSGTYANFSYKLFGKDFRADGFSFKIIFKTANIKKANATFLDCITTSNPSDKSGLKMNVHEAYINTDAASLYIPYSEEDVIEFEYNINPLELDSNTGDFSDTATSYIMSYEDGVALRPLIYTKAHNIEQYSPTDIKIGSEDCDVYIYRMRAYERSLTDLDILSNFIIDSPNSDEMASRYNRNQIYETSENILNPQHLAEKCPDLRIILIDAPRFTYDKDDKVPNTTIQMIYKNGDPVLDNWTCYNAKHSGQGTSSNKYGYAGRNLDLIMNGDESYFQLGDGTVAEEITLTRESVPTNYLNVKVNIASSENENNAQMAQRYNRFNPYTRPAKKNNSKVKDCMEFYNCVVFIRETGVSYDEEDENGSISTITPERQEFKDGNYHFYAIGNVGDSKKTDKTRVDDKDDPKECIVEIMDYNVALAEFPKGDGEFKAGVGNEAYDRLYGTGAPITIGEDTYDENGYRYKDGKFKSFGCGSYEFRYEKKGISEEERQSNIDAWRSFYKFVILSTDEGFYQHLKDYFIVDSALYYYLFTERYTMVDNRAKNSFWHRSKVYISQDEAFILGDKAKNYIVDDQAASVNDGYRWDLCFGYDFDTCLGIDNTGRLVLDYGKEDIDKYEDESYIFRAAESTFFVRLRELFHEELKRMFNDRETAYAWSATGPNGLINQWDNKQIQFPEELWRRDIERKYLRTYRGVSVDNSIEKGADTTFLESMMNGRKKYQRRQFERDQEIYFASKYVSQSIQNNFIKLRAGNPSKGEGGKITTADVVPPNFSLYLTPYIDMYLTVNYGAGNGNRGNIRVKAGTEQKIEYNESTADLTYIYGASHIQAIGDLSAFYPYEVQFGNATRLQKLEIGSKAEGYENNFLTSLSLVSNTLLEYLDISNTSKLESDLNLSNCQNLKELYAEGSKIQKVSFANQGKLQKAYLPDTVTGITLSNLNDIIELDLNTDNLTEISIKSSNVNELNIVSDAIDNGKLQTLKLYEINWTSENGNALTSTDLLNKALDLHTSEITGNIQIIGNLKSYELENYNSKWNDLNIIYDSYNLIQYYSVTYVGSKGEILYSTYVQEGEKPKDPVKEGWIDPPVKESDSQYNYQYKGWDEKLNSDVTRNIEISAVFDSIIRTYTVNWYSKNKNEGGQLLYSLNDIKYGEEVNYPEDNDYQKHIQGYITTSPFRSYLFTGWDKSTGFIRDNIDVYAKWEVTGLPKFDYDQKSFVKEDGSRKEFWEMTENEIHAIVNYDKMIQLGEIKDSGFPPMWEIFDPKDYHDLRLGVDFDFDNVESKVIVSEDSPENFDGKTVKETGIYLFGEEDKSFTLAIDFRFSDTYQDNTLISCFKNESNIKRGFRLSFADVPYIGATLEGSSSGISKVGNYASTQGFCRGMVVIRYRKGENTLYVYNDAQNNAIADFTIKENLFDNTNYNGFRNNYSLKGLIIPEKSLQLVLGAIQTGSNSQGNPLYDDFTKGYGQINWCKIWYDDLGESNAKKLASWPHEILHMEYGDVPLDIDTLKTKGRYQLNKTEFENSLPSQENLYSSMFLIPQNPLQDRMSSMDVSSNSESNWGNCKMNSLLNGRLFNSFPLKWKQIIRESQVKYVLNANDVYTTTSKIFLPSNYDMGGMNDNNYNREGNVDFGSVNFYTDQYASRIKFQGYFLNSLITGRIIVQSEDPSTDSANDIQLGDMWRTTDYSQGHLYLTKEIVLKYGLIGCTSAADGNYWLPSINYWLRTKTKSSTSNYNWVYVTGGLGSTSQSNIIKVLPCFSI